MRGLIALSLACVAAAAPSYSVSDEGAPIIAAADAEHIPNSYIVKFK
jgi:cerevisin